MSAHGCYCLCGKAHPDQPGICDATRPVTTETVNSPTFGEIKIPLCAPCAAARAKDATL